MLLFAPFFGMTFILLSNSYCYQTQVQLLAAQESNTERQVLGKRKDGFTEEAGNPGEMVDSRPKEPASHSPGFARRFYRERRKGLCAEERAVGAWSARGHPSDWLVVR